MGFSCVSISLFPVRSYRTFLCLVLSGQRRHHLTQRHTPFSSILIIDCVYTYLTFMNNWKERDRIWESSYFFKKKLDIPITEVIHVKSARHYTVFKWFRFQSIFILNASHYRWLKGEKKIKYLSDHSMSQPHFVLIQISICWSCIIYCFVCVVQYLFGILNTSSMLFIYGNAHFKYIPYDVRLYFGREKNKKVIDWQFKNKHPYI